MSLGDVVGMVCVSRAGHDMGSFYVISGVDDDGFVLCVNGENRPLGNPKRKNITHITIMKNRTAATSDTVIKRALKGLKGGKFE
jgi:ribosomal protein L14E/L6E/L27E